MTVIVAGWIQVASPDRDTFLATSHDAMVAARRTPGCRAFVVAPDPIEADPVNVYEEWDSGAELESFRGDGPSDDHAAFIVDARVSRHEVSSSLPA